MNIEQQYLQLMYDVLIAGRQKADRTGVGTLSLFGRTLYHNMDEGFPLLTTKKISFNNVKTELLWILNGRTDLKFLEDNGVKYWRADYNRSGRTDETLGPVYGKQWRNFNGADQLKDLFKEITVNPSSRRLLLSAWAPHEMNEMALPPCHYAFQVYINDGKMDLMWTQRSADIFLGLPYDIAMYGLLLQMLAKGTGYRPGMLIGQLGDAHLYNNHLEQVKVQLNRPMLSLPWVEIHDNMYLDNEDNLHIPDIESIKLDYYNPFDSIKADLNVG